MKDIKFKQFLFPDGREKEAIIKRPEPVADRAEVLQDYGFSLSVRNCEHSIPLNHFCGMCNQEKGDYLKEQELAKLCKSNIERIADLEREKARLTIELSNEKTLNIGWEKGYKELQNRLKEAEEIIKPFAELTGEPLWQVTGIALKLEHFERAKQFLNRKGDGNG